MRLDRKMVHQDNIGLGLQQAPGPSINAKLRAKSFETISTQSRQTTACAIPKGTNTIWRKETIHNTRIKGTIIRQQSQVVIQQVCSKFLFLGRAVDSTLLLPNQLHSFAVIQTNWRHNATNTTAPQLPGHTRRRSTLLPRKQHGASSTLQHKLFEQAKRTKPSGWTLLPFKQYNCLTKQWSNSEHSTHH